MTESERKSEKVQDRLDFWQKRLDQNKTDYAAELEKMDHRHTVYKGDRSIRPVTSRQRGEITAPHVRNVIAEDIESMVSSAIPQPKVTAVRQEDEGLAKIIEDMLRGELNRLPAERLNDESERVVPIQGGAGWLVEWDNTQMSHEAAGDVTLSLVHPKKLIPQSGVYSGIEDMDCIFLEVPQTKEYIRRRYGVNVDEESEEAPENKSAVDTDTAEDMVTLEIAYYRNDSGGIGKFAWVDDIPLEDLEDFQQRILKRCKNCGALKPDTEIRETAEQGDERKISGQAGGAEAPRLRNTQAMVRQAEEAVAGMQAAGILPEDVTAEISVPDGAERIDPDACPVCGCTEWENAPQEWQEVFEPIRTRSGEIPGADETGKPNRIPFYKPSVYPIVLQKNISVFGEFLGMSDVDRVEDLQNTLTRVEKKIVDRICKAGTKVTLPEDRADLNLSDQDADIWRVSTADCSAIHVYDFKGDLEYELYYDAQLYNAIRQAHGVTDSYQGRTDSTATSGKAKQFAAAQAAGRMESKRIMKLAAWADIFKLIFQYKLAYADEPRPVRAMDEAGNTVYEAFNRYDFLMTDESGEYWWDDLFLFDADSTEALASNREQLWQETTQMYTAGTFGDPADGQTRMFYWSKMAMLHYPGAEETKAYIQKAMQLQQAQQQAMQAQQAQQQAMQAQQQNAQQTDNGAIRQRAQAAAQQQAMADADARIRKQAEADAERQARADAGV